MVERFKFHKGAEYPGKASVIFYKNGSTLELDREGQPTLSASHADAPPRYMEADCRWFRWHLARHTQWIRFGFRYAPVKNFREFPVPESRVCRLPPSAPRTESG